MCLLSSRNIQKASGPGSWEAEQEWGARVLGLALQASLGESVFPGEWHGALGGGWTEE